MKLMKMRWFGIAGLGTTLLATSAIFLAKFSAAQQSESIRLEISPQFTPSSRQVTLRWTASQVDLETSTNVEGPYVAIAQAVSPQVIDASSGPRFYRLRQTNDLTGGAVHGFLYAQFGTD